VQFFLYSGEEDIAMRFQDYVINSIQNGFDEVFKYARQIPADKLEWKPMDTGRSALDQCQEIAQCPDYVTAMLGGAKEEPAPDAWEQLVKERQSWTTIDKCEEVAKEKLGKLFEAIRATSEEDLKKTVWLPYDGGRDFTWQEVMEYPRWNANYHAGQIAYIQTLYGDKEMH